MVIKDSRNQAADGFSDFRNWKFSRFKNNIFTTVASISFLLKRSLLGQKPWNDLEMRYVTFFTGLLVGIIRFNSLIIPYSRKVKFHLVSTNPKFGNCGTNEILFWKFEIFIPFHNLNFSIVCVRSTVSSKFDFGWRGWKLFKRKGRVWDY